MYITAQMLQDIDAPEPQVNRFLMEWPDGVEISRDSLERAAELCLDMHYFAFCLLPLVAWRAYRCTEVIVRDQYFRDKDVRGYYYSTRQAAHKRVVAWRTYQQATVTALLSAIQGMTA